MASQYSPDRAYYYPRGTSVSARSFDAVVDRTLSRSVGYERQLKEFESKLSENFSNYRAVEGLLQEALTILKRNSERAKHAETRYVPRMEDQLTESEDILAELLDGLPKTRQHVKQIRQVYDSGRKKAQLLVADLEWLNLDWYDRWRKIIFTSSAPVSWRWKALMRLLFALFFVTFAWVAWIALKGAYRAHRHRLVWGERVLS
ncbi:hypothetical protein OE88DRAFT_1655510 [Heliocybe sulcata]|uniref:Uncharacterized protein n=1 Tax=Heliocybe sulcata TaxID=5364 RepID=A0A5C3N6H0_9AGAM|nr:hypothetical protein OE88DRAFT_1655510 [Heliocybe sulcata]